MGGSPARPPALFSRPMWILPPRKVPVVEYHSLVRPEDEARLGYQRRRRSPFSISRSSTALLEDRQVRL